MCGRYTHLYTWRQLHRLMGLTASAEPEGEALRPSYNLAPTQNAPVVRQDDAGVRYVSSLRWGLIPPWANDPSIGSRMINARSEEVTTKPAYRSAVKKRRCLVPASGFYEWQLIPGSKTKQPWYFTVTGEPVLAFAGIWERWDKGGEPLETFCILTGAPNPLVNPVHDRMPCIVDPNKYARWLDSEVEDFAPLATILSPFPPERMTAWPVSTRVGSPRNNDPLLIERIEGIGTLPA